MPDNSSKGKKEKKKKWAEPRSGGERGGGGQPRSLVIYRPPPLLKGAAQLWHVVGDSVVSQPVAAELLLLPATRLACVCVSV